MLNQIKYWKARASHEKFLGLRAQVAELQDRLKQEKRKSEIAEAKSKIAEAKSKIAEAKLAEADAEIASLKACAAQPAILALWKDGRGGSFPGWFEEHAFGLLKACDSPRLIMKCLQIFKLLIF